MQTFLPYPSFEDSARVLDRQRLGKQRVEVLQLLKALTVPNAGWSNHPATKMWRGFEKSLADYGLVICVEWKNRGYKDTCYEKTLAYCEQSNESVAPPPWLGDEAFHASHRSNLLRKLPEHYSKFGWKEHSGLAYIWPQT